MTGDCERWHNVSMSNIIRSVLNWSAGDFEWINLISLILFDAMKKDSDDFGIKIALSEVMVTFW